MSERKPLLDQYCDNLANYLTAHCSWLKSVGDALQETPCALIHIKSWNVAKSDEHNGQTRLNLDIQLLVVVSHQVDNYRRTARNRTAELTCVIADSTLNMPYLPAQVVGVQLYTLDKALDDYEVWEIRYQQAVDFGQSLFESEGHSPTAVWVGVSPDIGMGHKDDYQQVIPEPSDE